MLLCMKYGSPFKWKISQRSQPFAKPIGQIPTWGSEGLGAGMATNRANIVNAPW